METIQSVRSRRFIVHFQLLSQLFQKIKGLVCGLFIYFLNRKACMDKDIIPDPGLFGQEEEGYLLLHTISLCYGEEMIDADDLQGDGKTHVTFHSFRFPMTAVIRLFILFCIRSESSRPISSESGCIPMRHI